MNIETIPEGWIEIDETDFRLILDSMDWRRDAFANGEYFREKSHSFHDYFALRLGTRIFLRPDPRQNPPVTSAS
jgi:hypothetical protein